MSINRKLLQSILYNFGALLIIIGVFLRYVFVSKTGWYFMIMGSILGIFAAIIRSRKSKNRS